MRIESACKIYPEVLTAKYLDNPKARAELIVYKALARQLGPEYTVYYDVAWLAPVKSKNPHDGQTDFVIAHPTRGILLVEVKGGAISYDANNRQWYSKGAEGIFKIDPLEQVRTSKYALLDKLLSIPKISEKRINIYHAAAFPQAPVPPNLDLLDAPADILIGEGDLSKLGQKIDSIFQYYNQTNRNWDDGPSVLTELHAMLGKSYEFRTPLAQHCETECNEILRLTQEQFDLLDNLNQNRRMAVRGCAGSGKTCLAVEKARRLAEEGYKTLLTCFNRPLAEHLTTVTPAHKLLTVANFHTLCFDSARAIGVELPIFERGKKNEGLDEKYVDTLRQAFKLKPELRFDAIIVDEGQDFHNDWWDALEACFSSENSIFYIFYDDNQVLYKDRGCVPKNMTDFALTSNIRNSRSIFDQVRPFYRNEYNVKMKSKGPEGRKVERHEYTSDDSLRRGVFSTIQRLIEEERFDARDLVVLTPKKLNRSSLLVNDGPGNEPYRLVETPSKYPNEVFCSTIHSFKGLESKCVLVAELDEEMLNYTEDDRANRYYVGFSRAKTHLTIFAKPKVMQQLQAERGN